MSSEVKTDKLSQRGSSGIVITDDIKLSSGKAIKNAAGTALLTQAGVLDNVSLGSSVTGLGLKDAIIFRKMGNRVNDEAPVLNWEVADDTTGESYLGASASALVTETSGFFEMQQTGYILLLQKVNVYATSAWCNVQIYYSVGNSTDITDGSWVLLSDYWENSADYMGGYNQCLIKTTTTATDCHFYVKFDAAETDGQIRGADDAENWNKTTMCFIKLADL